MTETFKIVLVGDTAVGKTSILQRYARDVFDDNQETTVGPQFTTRMIDLPSGTGKMKLQIWDTAGQEKYRSVTPIYYRDAAAAICVFDMTHRSTLDDVEKWLSDLKQYAPANIIIGVAANKCDLYGQEEVSLEDGNNFREKHQLHVY